MYHKKTPKSRTLGVGFKNWFKIGTGSSLVSIKVSTSSRNRDIFSPMFRHNLTPLLLFAVLVITEIKLTPVSMSVKVLRHPGHGIQVQVESKATGLNVGS